MIFTLVLGSPVASDSCSAMSGTCKSVSSCDTSSNTVLGGLCPGPADIKCCAPVTCEIPATGGVYPGFCLPASSCKGRKQAGLCPGSADIQCCSTAPTPVKSPSAKSVINPTTAGKRILSESLKWAKLQLQPSNIGYYPKRAMCAINLSKVLEMSGINGYSSPLVPDQLNRIKAKITNPGRDVIIMPPNVGAAEKVKAINVGAVVAGCVDRECTGSSGDGHISHVCFVSDVTKDASGKLAKATYHLCHNNWLRQNVNPNRALGGSLGTVGKYMINQSLFKSGAIERQWMNTPWITMEWTNGQVSKVTGLLPELDDLDISTGYWIFVHVPVEISKELTSESRIFESA